MPWPSVQSRLSPCANKQLRLSSKSVPAMEVCAATCSGCSAWANCFHTRVSDGLMCGCFDCRRVSCPLTWLVLRLQHGSTDHCQG